MSRGRPTNGEHARTRALVQVLEGTPERLPLWARMQHTVGTCDPGTCPLCLARVAEGAA